MYYCMNVYEGTPPRLYRTPLEIRRDINSISAKIREIEEMLSVHNLLIEMIPQWAEQSPERWIPELEDTVAEAQEALENLGLLKSALEELQCELEEVRCLLKK